MVVDSSSPYIQKCRKFLCAHTTALSRYFARPCKKNQENIWSNNNARNEKCFKQFPRDIVKNVVSVLFGIYAMGQVFPAETNCNLPSCFWLIYPGSVFPSLYAIADRIHCLLRPLWEKKV